MRLGSRLAAAARALAGKSASEIAAGTLSQGDLMMMGKEKPFSPREELTLYQSWVYIAANKNASAIGATPMRLYSLRGRGESMPKLAPFRKLCRSEIAALKFVAPSRTIPAIDAAASVVEITDHPFLRLMATVNEFRNRLDFMEETVLSLDVTGNTYWRIETGTGIDRGIPKKLWILPSHLVTILPDKRRFIKGYKFGKDPVNKQELRPEDVVHFRLPNLRDQYYGMSRIEGVFLAARGNRNMDVYEAALTGNRSIPDLLIRYTKGQLGRSRRREALREWNEVTQGIGNTGGAAITDEDFEIKPLNLPPRELGFLNGRKWRREELLNAFGQNLSLYTENANRANVEGAIYIWGRFTLDPAARRIAEKISERLLPMYDGGERLICAFDQIAGRDKEFELKQDETDIRSKVRSVNEVREDRGLPPFDDPAAGNPFENVGPPPGAAAPPIPGTTGEQAGGAPAKPKKAIPGESVHPELNGVTVYAHS